MSEDIENPNEEENENEEELKDSNDSLEIAEKLENSLKELEVEDNREGIIKALKETFLARRMQASSRQEQLRQIAIDKLIDKISDPNSNIPLTQLLSIIEKTAGSGQEDLTSLIGGAKGSPLVSINNGPSLPAPSDSPTEKDITPAKDKEEVQGIGQVMEALTRLSQSFPELDVKKDKDDIIDVDPEE